MLAERVKEWTREWKEEGLQQGRQEGRQEGIQLGEAAVLLRLIEIKFGPLSESERQKIQAADINTLLQWSERILTADTKEDVFE
jgi:predicted transposase YdaD